MQGIDLSFLVKFLGHQLTQSMSMETSQLAVLSISGPTDNTLCIHSSINTISHQGLKVCMQDEQADEEAELRGLKGLKVKHTANELLEGETMILTLADKNILDNKGELDEEEQDELENVLAVGPIMLCSHTLSLTRSITVNCNTTALLQYFQATTVLTVNQTTTITRGLIDV